MWITILTWLAKFLINYFLKTSQELKVTLESAVLTTESLQRKIAEQRKINIDSDLALQKMRADSSLIERDIEEINKRYATLQKERDSAIDSLTNDAVIRGKL